MKVMLGLMGALTAIAICVVLNYTSGVFIPLLIAWLILLAINPIIKPITTLGRTLHIPGIKKGLSPLANLVIVFAILIGLGVIGFNFCTRQIVEFSKAYNQYYPKLNDMTISVMNFLQIPEDVLPSFNWLSLLRNSMLGISGMLYGFSKTFVLTLIFLMFMLFEAPFMDDKLSKAFPNKIGDTKQKSVKNPVGASTVQSEQSKDSKTVNEILDEISKQISSYLGTLALISAATGVCVWFVLLLLGVELAGGWAVLTFLLNFIPTVGSIIATIPPVLMAILQFSPSFIRPLIVLASLTTIQILIGNVLTPKVVGDRLGLSPIMILISLLLWGLIWGIPGTLLSVPIASILKIVCENIKFLRPIAILMGSGDYVGRATPVNVKQRRPKRRSQKWQNFRINVTPKRHRTSAAKNLPSWNPGDPDDLPAVPYTDSEDK